MFIIKYLKTTLYIEINIIIFSLIITLLNYFDILNQELLSIFKTITIIISFMIGGIYIGKKSSCKGYTEGLKLSFVSIIILFLLNFLGFNNNFSFDLLMLYIIIIISTTLGSIIGINKKRN